MVEIYSESVTQTSTLMLIHTVIMSERIGQFQQNGPSVICNSATLCMQKLQALRVHLREKFAIDQPQGESSDQVKMTFRFPDSTKVELCVSSSQSTQVHYVTYEMIRSYNACDIINFVCIM